MIDERIIELIQKEIDGTILPAEQAMLEEYRSSDAEVRKTSSNFSLLASMLHEVREVDPPSTLKARVMREIEPQLRPYRQPVGQALRAAVVDFFRPRTGFRPVYAFSAGVLAGVVLFSIYLGVGGRAAFDSRDAIGTMLVGSVKNLQVGGEFSINVGNIHGVVTTQYSQELSILTVSLNTETEVVTRISFDPSSLDMRAVRRSENAGDGLSVHGGEIELRSSGGHTYAIYFGNVTSSLSPVRIMILSSGNPLYDNKITLGPMVH